MCVSWLSGIVNGDGYLDERHVEIYNSSIQILYKTVHILSSICDKNRVKIDIYSDDPEKIEISKWYKLLNLPQENFKTRKNTSPWKARTEKIRVRIASKELAGKIKNDILNPKNKREYIKGIFDAEASVDIKGYIEFKQKATDSGMKITKRVFELIRKEGIETTIPKTKNDGDKKIDVYFYVKDIKKYRENIGFTDKTKKIKLDIIINAKKINKSSSIKKIKSLLKEKNDLWFLIKETNTPYHKIRNIMKKNNLTIRQTR